MSAQYGTFDAWQRYLRGETPAGALPVPEAPSPYARGQALPTGGFAPGADPSDYTGGRPLYGPAPAGNWVTSNPRSAGYAYTMTPGMDVSRGLRGEYNGDLRLPVGYDQAKDTPKNMNGVRTEGDYKRVWRYFNDLRRATRGQGDMGALFTQALWKLRKQYEDRREALANSSWDLAALGNAPGVAGAGTPAPPPPPANAGQQGTPPAGAGGTGTAATGGTPVTAGGIGPGGVPIASGTRDDQRNNAIMADPQLFAATVLRGMGYDPHSKGFMAGFARDRLVPLINQLAKFQIQGNPNFAGNYEEMIRGLAGLANQGGAQGLFGRVITDTDRVLGGGGIVDDMEYGDQADMFEAAGQLRGTVMNPLVARAMQAALGRSISTAKLADLDRPADQRGTDLPPLAAYLRDTGLGRRYGFGQ